MLNSIAYNFTLRNEEGNPAAFVICGQYTYMYKFNSEGGIDLVLKTEQDRNAWPV